MDWITQNVDPLLDSETKKIVASGVFGLALLYIVQIANKISTSLGRRASRAVKSIYSALGVEFRLKFLIPIAEEYVTFAKQIKANNQMMHFNARCTFSVIWFLTLYPTYQWGHEVSLENPFPDPLFIGGYIFFVMALTYFIASIYSIILRLTISHDIDGFLDDLVSEHDKLRSSKNFRVAELGRLLATALELRSRSGGHAGVG